jgi:hypothetical protein
MWQALRQAEPDQDSPNQPALTAEAPPIREEDPGYCCALCGELIARRDACISVQGAHEHRFSNPAGYLFHIGCFGAAPGCLIAGEPEEFYSWFDGCTWRYALCRGCRAHLGWRFSPAVQGQGQGFFGLILDRLSG